MRGVTWVPGVARSVKSAARGADVFVPLLVAFEGRAVGTILTSYLWKLTLWYGLLGVS